jgi:TrmH family RNA methyltransferase
MARTGALITSLTNESVKLARSLTDRKARRASDLFLAEGRDMLMRAERGGFVPQHVFMQDTAAGEAWSGSIARWALSQEARVSSVTEGVMAKLSSMNNPSPVAAILRQRHALLPATVDIRPQDTWLALEDIRDPGNLGSILRTADAAGAKGVILVGDCADPFSPEAVRASAGSIFAVPVVSRAMDRFIGWSSGWPGSILGSSASGTIDFRQATYRHPVLLLIGSESHGLSAGLTGICHQLARVPMSGTAESLNVAIAAALFLYEVRRTYLPA